MKIIIVIEIIKACINVKRKTFRLFDFQSCFRCIGLQVDESLFHSKPNRNRILLMKQVPSSRRKENELVRRGKMEKGDVTKQSGMDNRIRGQGRDIPGKRVGSIQKGGRGVRERGEGKRRRAEMREENEGRKEKALPHQEQSCSTSRGCPHPHPRGNGLRCAPLLPRPLLSMRPFQVESAS